MTEGGHKRGGRVWHGHYEEVYGSVWLFGFTKQ